MKQKSQSGSTSPTDAKNSPKSLPYPKKILRAIKDLPIDVVKNKPPKEFVRYLKSIVKKIGSDAAADDAHILSPLTERFAESLKGKSAQEVFDRTGEIINAVNENNPTFKATVPLVLRYPDNRSLEQIGSGVIVRIANRVFLMTAAHVFDRRIDGDILIPGKDGFTALQGYSAGTRLPKSGRRVDDKMDVAYCWLDQAIAENLDPRCLILERPDVSLDANPTRRTTYTFTGFPWRKTDIKGNSVETDFNTMSGIEAKADEYEAIGLDRSLSIAIRFHRRRMFHYRKGKVITSPLPHGMSGGGVYQWSEDAMKHWPVRLPLAGIANTYLPERSLLIATRLHVYVDCIFHNQPDLAAMANAQRV